MTYDEAIENISSLFKNGTYNGWMLTDPDTVQACKEIFDGRICIGYSFIELQSHPYNEETALLLEDHYTIEDYTANQLWEAGKAYYTDREEFNKIPLYQKFECVFETESTPDEDIVLNQYREYLWLLEQ